MIYIIASITSQPGRAAEITQRAALAIEETRKEAGNISYDLNQSVTDPDALVFVERWESREAISAHMKSDHLIAFQKSIRTLVAGVKVERIEDGTVTII